MATFIKSISFQNFYNYYGSFEDNTYYFSKGINIINADNNMGKSKFYNGILWLLENQVYDSDSKCMEPAESSLSKMASGKAVNDNEDFEMGVQIQFEADDKSYLVTKHVAFKKRDNALIKGDCIVDVIKTENNKDYEVFDEDEKQQIVAKIIPHSLRNYALLQGESMERLVDLSSRDGLSSTIDTLAGISILRDICYSAKKQASTARSQYLQKDKAYTDNNKDAQLARDNYDRMLTRIENLRESILYDSQELDRANSEKDELEAYLVSAAKRGNIRNELRSIEKEISDKKNLKDATEKSITSLIFNDRDPWILMGLEDEIAKYSELRDKHIANLAVQNNDNTLVIMLPEGSPDVASLNRMLTSEVCEVCGQPAHRGSEAWKHIKMILDRPKKKVTTRNHLSYLWDILQKNTAGYSQTIPNIEEQIQDKIQQIEDLESELEALTQKRGDFFVQLSQAGGNSTASENDDVDIMSRYNYASNIISELTKRKEDNISALRKAEIFVKTYEDKRELTGQNEEVIKAKKYSETLKAIQEVFDETKDRIFDDILASLEVEANRKYQELTEGNQSSGGRLSFKKQQDGTVRVSIRNVNDGLVTGLGTGFQRMKQLSIVMAIISSKIGDKQFDYPFISDAPFSEFGENFISNFFAIAPNVFSQCIIMIKELYDPIDPQLLNTFGKRILKKMKEGEISGTFYVNVIKDKADTTGLVTSHKCYKK